MNIIYIANKKIQSIVKLAAVNFTPGDFVNMVNNNDKLYIYFDPNKPIINTNNTDKGMSFDPNSEYFCIESTIDMNDKNLHHINFYLNKDAVKKYKLGNNLNAILRTMFNNYINLYTTQNPGHRFDFNLITSKGINGPSNWANFPNIIRDYLNSP